VGGYIIKSRFICRSIGDSGNASSTTTPKPRGGRGGKKTPKTPAPEPKKTPAPEPKKTPAPEPKKKRGANNINTPLTKDASTSSPVKDVAVIKAPPAKPPPKPPKYGELFYNFSICDY